MIPDPRAARSLRFSPSEGENGRRISSVKAARAAARAKGSGKSNYYMLVPNLLLETSQKYLVHTMSAWSVARSIFEAIGVEVVEVVVRTKVNTQLVLRRKLYGK